ncbi:MAG: hypothetical protein MZV63_45600 [Marinilabiliales bacterium]|nr:hypothetical protein [Marinilabiliales bacterium]
MPRGDGLLPPAHGRSFRALGAGFRALKKRFWVSYGIVLVILITECRLHIPLFVVH